MNIDEAFAQALQKQLAGQLAEAEALYRQLVGQAPKQPVVWYNLGLVQLGLNQANEAAASNQRALELQPYFPEAAQNLGMALTRLGQWDDAVVAFRRAVAQKPDFAGAWNSLGAALKDQGKLDEAIHCLDQAMQLQPGNAAFHSNRVFARQYGSDQDNASLLLEAKNWNERHGAPLKEFISAHSNEPNADRRLRVGYVSPYFRQHCQALFTSPLFAHHDHDRCEIFCYSDVALPDAMTAQLQSHADHWRDTAGLSDEQLAAVVREDQIDVLVDLTLHMAQNRLRVFARKPAPVQFTWLGYPGTTGLDTIDYRLTDPWLDPPGTPDAFYIEASLLLPESFWCYDPLTSEPSVNELPARKPGQVVFGCLNNFCKINERTLALWAKVLQATPDSRLLLLAPTGEARRDFAKKLGIHSSRVEFSEYRPRPEYLALYHRVDLCLDTFPYNGHTTSMDAFWMGVPVITLCGETAVSRAGLSLASNLGLPELVAKNPEQFAQLAVNLANDLPRLTQLRAGLRQRMTASPLMNAPRFARHVEDAYRIGWRSWCKSR